MRRILVDTTSYHRIWFRCFCCHFLNEWYNNFSIVYRANLQNRKKKKEEDEIVHKKYCMTSGVYHFGPLIVGKNRDRYKEGKYPENMEVIE